MSLTDAAKNLIQLHNFLKPILEGAKELERIGSLENYEKNCKTNIENLKKEEEKIKVNINNTKAQALKDAEDFRNKLSQEKNNADDLQKSADKYFSDKKTEADKLIKSAKDETKIIIENAKNKADAIIENANKSIEDKNNQIEMLNVKIKSIEDDIVNRQNILDEINQKLDNLRK